MQCDNVQVLLLKSITETDLITQPAHMVPMLRSHEGCSSLGNGPWKRCLALLF